MSIKPIGHYSFENPASIYDEEALTALELAGRTAGKVNETIRAFNDLEQRTGDHLQEQDQEIDTRLSKQDNRLTRMEEVQIPQDVKEEVNLHIESGAFDKAISDYAGDLEGRVDNLLGSVSTGSTSMDAEVIDIRTNPAGVPLANAGTAVRDSYHALSERMGNTSVYSLDMVKEMLATEEVFTGDLEGVVSDTENNGTWKFVEKIISLLPGHYTLVVDAVNLPLNLEKYGLQIKQGVSGGTYHGILADVMAPGVYPFTVRSGDEWNPACQLLLQLSAREASPNGHYYARGIHIYKGHITGKQGLPDSFTGVDKCVRKVIGKNLFNPEEATHGYYLKANGEATPEREEFPGQAHSGYIPVEAGQTYAFTPFTFNGTGGFHGFYTDRDEATFITGSGLDTDALTACGGVVTAPEGAKYFRFSYKQEDEASIMVELGNVQTAYEAYTDNAPQREVEKRVTALEAVNTTAVKRNRADMVTKRNIGYIDFVKLNTCDFKNGETVSIYIKTDNTFDCGGILIQLGDGGESYRGATIDIQPDHMLVTDWKGETETYEAMFEHNNTILLTMTMDRLGAVNGMYSCDEYMDGDSFYIPFGGFPGSITVVNKNNDSATFDCTIIAHSYGNEYKTWLFGDSYFDYWPHEAYGGVNSDGAGIKDTLFDSYSGRNSAKALASLKKRLAKATPERIVWCMGMNDEDTDTVNANWLVTFEEVKRLCEANNIELIVSTVPTTDERNNDPKNEIIRNSGLRVIDLDDYLNIYVTDWLSGDGVHPSEIGSKAIGRFMVACVPEMRKEENL